MLEDTQPFFQSASDLAAKIELNWRRLLLPPHLKGMFATQWSAQIGYPAEQAPGMLKLFTSSDKFEYVSDIPLAKAVCAYPLRKALHSYKEVATELAETSRISTFKKEFKDQRDTPPPSWSLWEAAINASSLTSEEKTRLRTFLCNYHAFHEIKGISRDDFAQPAICKAIGHRVDRFGIADQIVAATDQTLYDQLVAFILEKSASADKIPADISLGESFNSALVETGFRVS